METKIVLNGVGKQRIHLFPERDCLRIISGDIVMGNKISKKAKEQSLSWDEVVKALNINVDRSEDDHWWAATSE